MSRTSNIESDNSQNGGSDGIFPHFSTPSIKNKLRVEQICRFFQIIQIIMFFRAIWTVLVASNFQKNGPKKIGPKIFGPKKIGPKKFGPNKFGPKKFGPKIIGVPKKLVLKKFGPEKIGPKKIGPKILVPRNQF